jgi:hypothetical protein
MQLKMEMPKINREKKLVVMLNQMDIIALEKGMETVGETNKSIFIRRLIHDFKRAIK